MAKHPGGRPTKYHDGMPQLLLDDMTAGISVCGFCARNDISEPTFYLWIKTHEEFSKSFDIGKKKCEWYWEQWLRENFNAEKVNSALVKLFFANRFDWHDKTESKNETKSEMKITHELIEVEEMRKKYDKEI